MGDFSAEVDNLLETANDPSAPAHLRGRAYEDVLEHVFRSVPGCLVRRNALNHFSSEEVDLAIGNPRGNDSFRLLPELFLVECKNWSKPVDSAAVTTFAAKIRHRSCDLGVLVAANGVTGDPYERSAAYQAAAIALAAERTRILLLTTDDLRTLRSGSDIVTLLHNRLLDLIAAGTFTGPDLDSSRSRLAP
ncbi:restriction endonuclease [Nocardia salmonicida]|uniref:restriction endonuclease n=1 Tax=Nocardia salmonicida TaxID=53431 RepID=UPI0037BAE39B